MQCGLVLAPVLLASLVQAIPIPNKIIGSAEVNCGEDDIEVIWQTENDFNGRVFAVGYADKDSCEAKQRGGRSTSIKIQKDDCGVTMTRTPQGLFVNFKVMVSFHHAFITKADRGFEISCFYMNADKTVTFPLTVSMKDLFGFTVPAEMPQCQYQVLDDVTGEEATVVAVGDKLRHKWTCSTTAPSLWCMRVKNCFVKDDAGTIFNIIQNDGCAVDPFLLNNLEYGPEGDGRAGGHLMAEQHAHAFKFADKVVVNFECTIDLSIRPEEGCEYPTCPDLPTTNRRRARDVSRSHVRSTNNNNNNNNNNSNNDQTDGAVTIDVRARQIDVLDPIGDFGVDPENAAFRSAVRHVASYLYPDGTSSPSDCIRPSVLVVPCAFAVVAFVSMAVVIALLWNNTRHKH